MSVIVKPIGPLGNGAVVSCCLWVVSDVDSGLIRTLTSEVFGQSIDTQRLSEVKTGHTGGGHLTQTTVFPQHLCTRNCCSVDRKEDLRPRHLKRTHYSVDSGAEELL
jgi:hypothetical protein